MRARTLLVAAFLAYVALDLGCPMIAGAFSFDPAASVDAVSVYRARPPAPPRVVSLPATTMLPSPAEPAAHAADTHGAPTPPGWRPHAVRDRHAAPDPRPSADDG
jgi:hypothetical protein